MPTDSGVSPAYTYAATCISVHDGDTASFDIDLGFDVHTHHPLRFYGINAPELATPAGKQALAFLLTILKPGDAVTVQTYKDQWDKYGRYLGIIRVPGQRASVNGQMVSSGHAAAWDGHGPAPVPAGRALGRLVRHDPRSLLYPAAQAAPVKSVRWARRSPILDQGNIGSCTGNAAAGWLATDNQIRQGRSDVTEQTALDIYSKATHLDRVKGVWPPDDTGSSGLAVAKALVRLGLTAGPYRHAFGLEHALSALQTGPALVGMTWLTGCDHPDSDGLVSYTGTVRGGHEVLADEVDVDKRLVWFANSWGSWGRDGRFAMTWDDFGKALADHGDVTVPS